MAPVRQRTRIRTSGYTLFELVVAMTSATVLMAGMASTIYIAFQGSDLTSGATANTLAGLAQLSEMTSELQFALTVTEKEVTAITFTVADRTDADTNPETIRYSWSGTAGDPLTRQDNGGATVALVDNVHDFGIEYHKPSVSIEYVTLWIRVSADSQAAVETTIPLLNQP